MKKIEYLLKNNLLIQKLYCIVFTVFFRFIGLFIRIDKKLVIFNSFSGKSFNDSPKVLYEAMLSRPEFKDYKFVWSFNHPKEFKGKLSCEVVKQDSFKYFLRVLKAGYWITNVNIERGLKLQRKGNFYINTWHGTGPKTSGNFVKNRKDYDFKHVNAILTTCEYHENLFINGFNARRSSLFRYGRPREDYLFNVLGDLDNENRRLREKYSLPFDKKIILFAPTWRETKDKGETYGTLQLFDLDKWSKELGGNYIILFKAHSITNSYSIPKSSLVIDMSSVEDINELYVMSDYLVSDYSSCFSDFSILEKPMFCYAPDYDEYISNRGILFDLNKYFVDKVIKDENTLIRAIKELDFEKYAEKTRDFKKEFACTEGNATEKVLSLILRNEKDELQGN